MRRFGRFLAGLVIVGSTVGAGLGAVVLGATPAGAATTFTVTDANDGAGPFDCSTPSGDCSLRAAITAANAVAGPSTIILPDASTVAHNPSASHIYQVLNSNGSLVLNDSGNTITISGAGQALAILQMQSGPITNRVLAVDSGTTATISGIRVEDGAVTGSGPAGGGGGILNDGTLNLSDSAVTGNSARFGAGVYLEGGVSTLTNVTVDSNTAGAFTGGVYVQDGTNDITGGSISNNTAVSDTGGLYIENAAPGDTTTVTGTTIASNTAGSDTGGVYVQNDGSTATNVTFTNVAIDSNTAQTDTGGLYVQNSGTGSAFTFNGGSVSNNTATTDTGGVFVENDGTNTTASFTNVAVNGNTAGTDTGGMYVENSGSPSTFTFAGGSVDNNSASTGVNGYAGGVYVENDGDPSSATISGGSISGNIAYIGAGVYVSPGTSGNVTAFNQETVAGNDATEAGAGFAFDTAQAGTTNITASTISGNRVAGLVGVSALLGDGGGILSQSCNGIALTNDTITGNTALNGGGYFGTQCAESPTVSTAFRFDTISGNTATDSGTGAGNVQTIDDSTVTFAQTIVANGSASGGPNPNCLFTGPGAVTSLGYNLTDTPACASPVGTDLTSKNPQLGALANNGGPTETLLPADSAPEVGAIPDATCVGTGVATDQRGIARGAGAASACTIGAVEVGQNFNGYRLVANEGGIFDFGLLFSGSLANNHLNAPIVGLANAPGPAGYLMVGGDGGVFALGGANFFGSLGGTSIPSPIAAIAAPPNESGYWLVAQNGKIYNYGSVPALPALSPPVGAHIVGMASTTDGQGAWLVDQLGDVYAEGSAHYVGGLGGVHINKPIAGIAAAAAGQGYVLVAADGGAFAYGTQHFFGSVPGSLKPGQTLNAPVVGIAVTHSGNGYWEVGSDGGVFNYGDAPFLGSMGGIRLNGPVVGIQHLGSVATPT